MGKSINRLRDKLWRIDPHCRYCGCETYLPDGEEPTDSMATIDHLYSKLGGGNVSFSPVKFPPEIRRVLCCWKCNNYKNIVETFRLGIVEVRKNMGAHPNPEYHLGYMVSDKEIPFRLSQSELKFSDAWEWEN